MKKSIIAFLLIIVSLAFPREKVRVPHIVDDTLRIVWKTPAEKPLYYRVFQRNYANPEKPIPLDVIVSGELTGFKRKLWVSGYTKRLTFFVVAYYRDRTSVVSDTLASFYGNPHHVFADVNRDGVVDDDDLDAVNTPDVLGKVIYNPGYNVFADVNGDGFIDIVDLGFIDIQICRKKNKEGYSQYNMYWQLP
jgi:hypothetical protein